jgi:hypothetical protein
MKRTVARINSLFSGTIEINIGSTWRGSVSGVSPCWENFPRRLPGVSTSMVYMGFDAGLPSKLLMVKSGVFGGKDAVFGWGAEPAGG